MNCSPILLIFCSFNNITQLYTDRYQWCYCITQSLLNNAEGKYLRMFQLYLRSAVRWLTQLGVSKDNKTPSKTGFGLAKAD